MSETIGWEVAKYLGRLADAVEPEQGIEAKLVRGLVFGHQAIDDHLLLQRVLSTEPEVFLADFQPIMPVMVALVQAEVGRLLADEQVRPGLDVDEAAGYVAGLFLSYLGSPGQWDLTDEVAVHRLVRTQFLAGILDPGRPDRPPTDGARPGGPDGCHRRGPLAMRQNPALLSQPMGDIAADNELSNDVVGPRILEAALRCIARWGMAKTTLDDVAREAGCSRATIYRAFPGGKQSVIHATGERELRRFLDDLSAKVGRGRIARARC